MTDRLAVARITREEKPIGTLYLSKVPVKYRDPNDLLAKVMPTVYSQLALRGHDRPIAFKALGCRWQYEPGLGE